MADITITGTYTDSEGDNLNGTVTFTPCLAGARDEAWVIATAVTATVLDGDLEVTLAATDSYAQVRGQVSYRVVERFGGTRTLYYIVAPSTLGVSVNISTLTRYSVPPNALIDPDDPGPSDDPEVSALQAQVAALEATVATLTSTLNSVSSTVSGHTTSISTINTELGSNPSGASATVAARLATMEELQADDNTARADSITQVEADLAAVDARVGNARLFAGTSYPPSGYTAQNSDVYIDTTGL